MCANHIASSMNKKIKIELTRDEADIMLRELDGLSGCCENEEMTKYYATMIDKVVIACVKAGYTLEDGKL